MKKGVARNVSMLGYLLSTALLMDKRDFPLRIHPRVSRLNIRYSKSYYLQHSITNISLTKSDEGLCLQATYNCQQRYTPMRSRLPVSLLSIAIWFQPSVLPFYSLSIYDADDAPWSTWPSWGEMAIAARAN